MKKFIFGLSITAAVVAVGCSDEEPAFIDRYNSVESVLEEMAHGGYDLNRQSFFHIENDGSLTHDSSRYVDNTQVYYVPQYAEGGRVFELVDGDTVSEYLFQMPNAKEIQHLIPQGSWRSFEILQIDGSQLVIRSEPLGPTGGKYKLELELKR